jgi:hypothetical protein
VATKNAVFWDVMSCFSCKNRRFGRIYRLHPRDEKNQRARNNVGVTVTVLKTSNCMSINPSKGHKINICHMFFTLPRHCNCSTENILEDADPEVYEQSKNYSSVVHLKEDPHIFIIFTAYIYTHDLRFSRLIMKNGVFWDVTPCSPCKNRRFGGI